MIQSVTVHVPRLHKHQTPIYRHPARFKVVACGRRWGKTTLGIRVVVEPALEGYPTAWFAPTYKLLAEVFDEVKRRCGSAVLRANRTEMRIELVSGGTIDFWTLADPDAGRGRKYKRVVIDEAATCRDLNTVWNFAILPTLIDLEGDAYFLSTPKGRDYFQQLFNKGKDPLNKDWEAWQEPTSNNPKIKGLNKFVEKMREELPNLAFRQEILAEFVEGEGLVFRKVRDCIKSPPEAPEEGRRYALGVDWGKSNDFTVLTVIDDLGQVVEIDRFNQIGWSVQRSRLEAIANKWKVEHIIAESNSMGDPNVETLQEEGLPVTGFYTLNDNKQEVMTALQLAFEKSEIGMIEDPVTIAELEAFEAHRLPSGKWRYEAPANTHDDTVVSLALAWRAHFDLGGLFLWG